jgi:cytidyltransferase-like protein
MKVIFLGKFQPPHLGHIRTIMKVAKEYTSVIVGITKGTPCIMEYEEIKKIFEELFSSYHQIEVVLIDGTIEDNTANLSQYDFDIVISGNYKVIETLKNKGFKTKYQERTDGIGYSGSEIRSLSHVVSQEAIHSKNISVDFKILPVALLKPLEKILPSHYQNIEKMIFQDGAMKKPLIIDNKYNIVLDGSHRYAFLVKNGFQYAPVITVNYSDDAIFVGNHLKHRYLKDENFIISKAEVIARALNENLFDARTTRHFFPFRKIDYMVSLEQLVKGESKDISYLLQSVSIEDEINEDLKYILEIEEELAILEAYKKEQKDVKKYLKTQIDFMKKIT